jgi:hypothetical protein
MSAPTKAPPIETVDQKVERLLKQWDDDTAYLSNSQKIQSHPALQEIIELGQSALPTLFRHLEMTRSGHLSRVLTVITGAHPAPPEIRGNGGEIASVWLAWSKDHGF